ncbi:MAG: putative DNA binding domain-containing protein [Candidatus Omnitrophica bacterium]|nr:putative DNA binding domain-containing protein [Candidatus Omnitrophota bacterium]
MSIKKNNLNLPINIEDLLTARTVEWERLEFKARWNPEDVMHTMCAFANDVHNLGGGYIVLGIAEQHGRPAGKQKGLSAKNVDKIQKEIIEIGHKIQPYYHPVVVPCVYKNKHIIVLWCIGGQTRPYKAPVSLSKDNKRFAYYVRKASKTVIAKAQDEKDLFDLASDVPFDDRINSTANVNDLELGLIRSFLQYVKSDLFEESAKMDFIQLCRNMKIIDGPDEAVRPKNVGLMFFNPEPDKYFKQAQIDVVSFPNGPGADNFTEKIFKGPLNVMLSDALNYIKSQFIEENIQKYAHKAEAEHSFNYSYVAIEEALTNAVYHRSYEIREPIEVRILPDKITIGSFPGPDGSIKDKDIEKGLFLSRRYRNRRIGEFLKELELTEGRGTGLPKIYQAIKKNGSPEPVIHTDDDRSFFIIEFPIHPIAAAIKKKKDTTVATTEVTTEVATEVYKLLTLMKGDQTKRELMSKLGLGNDEHFRKSYLVVALRDGLIAMTIPDKPTSNKQKYRLSEKGKRYLQQIDSSPKSC